MPPLSAEPRPISPAPLFLPCPNPLADLVTFSMRCLTPPYPQGGAAHLPGMVAAMTPLPVVGVPVKPSGAHLDGLDALLSIVQVGDMLECRQAGLLLSLQHDFGTDSRPRGHHQSRIVGCQAARDC